MLCKDKFDKLLGGGLEGGCTIKKLYFIIVEEVFEKEISDIELIIKEKIDKYIV